MKYGLIHIVIRRLSGEPSAASRAYVLEESIVSQGDLHVTCASPVGKELMDHIEAQGIEHIMGRIFPAWGDNLARIFAPQTKNSWSEHVIAVIIYPAANDNEPDAYEFAGEIVHFQRMVRKELRRQQKAIKETTTCQPSSG